MLINSTLTAFVRLADPNFMNEINANIAPMNDVLAKLGSTSSADSKFTSNHLMKSSTTFFDIEPDELLVCSLDTSSVILFHTFLDNISPSIRTNSQFFKPFLNTSVKDLFKSNYSWDGENIQVGVQAWNHPFALICNLALMHKFIYILSMDPEKEITFVMKKSDIDFFKANTFFDFSRMISMLTEETRMDDYLATFVEEKGSLFQRSDLKTVQIFTMIDQICQQHVLDAVRAMYSEKVLNEFTKVTKSFTESTEGIFNEISNDSNITGFGWS